LPEDASGTTKIISSNSNLAPLQVNVGCAKWNRQDLKGFYPRGTKDALFYYANQFNSIELNATFYRIFSKENYFSWHGKNS